MTFDCVLNGQVNPEEVPETEAWFEWGVCPSLGEITSKQKITEIKPVDTAVTGLRPNETYCYLLAGEDENVLLPQVLRSETEIFKTPTVPPRIVGGPNTQFVQFSSAVMSGKINPEKTETAICFVYGVGEALVHCLLAGCHGAPPCGEGFTITNTKALQRAAYGVIPVSLEANGLQPDTTYHYRLVAENEKQETARDQEGGTEIPEGEFRTTPILAPQATTGEPSVIGSTSATISGTANPDGQPAIFRFELGVYEGAATQYGIVFSGPAGTSTVPVPESLALTGLQPGTAYAYRIAVLSGNGVFEGQPATFTTEGLPSVLSSPTSLTMLATPHNHFPTTVASKPVPKCKRGYARNKSGKCAKQAKKTKRKTPKKRKKK